MAVEPIAANPKVYISASDNNGTLTVVPDPAFKDNSVIGQVDVGGNPTRLALTRDGKFAYVVCASTNLVSVVDILNLQVAATIKVGNSPFGIAMLP